MLPALVLGVMFALVPCSASSQATSVLHIHVSLVDAEGRRAPVPRHALLISDNPATASPRRVVTRPDGTIDARVPPGTYTVESDRPVVFGGKRYQWTQMIDVAAGPDTILELTVDNAEVIVSNPSVTTNTSAAGSVENDPWFLLPRWQDSVVALWTPTSRASGFVVNAKGFVATSRRAIGDATSVEVQFTPAGKVSARVLAADAVRDVAVLWVDPAVTPPVPILPVNCVEGSRSPVENGQEIFAIGVPLRGQKALTPGEVLAVESRGMLADLRLRPGDAGGPVFSADGHVIGISTIADETAETNRGDSRVVRIEAACDVLRSAEAHLKDAAPPSGTRLPVEPSRPFPVAALEDAGRRRGGGLVPYQVSSSDFEIAFITPVLMYAGQHRSGQVGGARGSSAGPLGAVQDPVRLLTDFGSWSEYVGEFPPVLLVRVTPKVVEGFWTMVARGAARTQGVSLPPIERLKSGFSRLRAFCGQTEVTPIHPFVIEQPISDTDAIAEGLYVFDPAALGPRCGTVQLVLYSQKNPGRGDTRVVDPKVIQQVWDDFAPYRSAEPAPGA